MHAFPDARAQAREVAERLGWPLAEVDLHRFPDGESRVRVSPGAGTHAVLMRSLHDPNVKLVELLLAADGLRRAGAERVTLVAPYLAYMRQDAVFAPGEAISQRVIGTLLGEAFDEVLCVEAHLHRTKTLAEVFRCPARSIPAAPALAAWLRTAPETLLVGPDEESEPWLAELARRSGLAYRVGTKHRRGDREVEVVLPAAPVAGAQALLVDDIVSSGATLVAAARALAAAGARRVDAVVVHAVFAPGALERLREAGVRRVATTDTIAHPTNQIAVAPLLASALAEAG